MIIENFLFEMYKNKPLKNFKSFSREIREKFKNIDISELYVKINNYQIDRYGEVISNQIDFYTKEDLMRMSINARERKKERLKRKD